MKITYYMFIGTSATQNEALKVAITEGRTTYYIASSKTQFKFVDVSDKFFDTQEEREKCLKMSEEEFDSTIVKTFVNIGYVFKGKKVE